MSILESDATIVFGEGQESCLLGALALYKRHIGGTVIFLEDHFYFYPPEADPSTCKAENLGEILDGKGQSHGTIYEPITMQIALNRGGKDWTSIIQGWTKREYIMSQVHQ